MDTRRRCISGGHGDRWRRAAQSCSLRLVDDPSSLPEQFPTEADQDKERQRLFRLIEELVKWDNANNRIDLEGCP